MMVSRKYLAAAALGTLGLGLVTWGFMGGAGATKRRRRRGPARGAPRPISPTTLKGMVVCPAEVSVVPASTAKLKVGDFVAVRVSDHAGTFSELVWGGVIGPSRIPNQTRIRIVPAIGDSSVIAPKVELHGFDIGRTLDIDRDCIWEVLHTNPHGMALCSSWGEQVAGRPPGGGFPGAAAGATVGQEVQIFLAPVKKGTVLRRGPGWNIENPVWAQIIYESPSRSIVRVQLLESPPVEVPGLELRKTSRLDITRDCIFGVQAGGST